MVLGGKTSNGLVCVNMFLILILILTSVLVSQLRRRQTMKLRNGKTIHPISMKKKINPRVVRNLTKVFEEMGVTEKSVDNFEANEEVKMFSRYLIYHCIEDLANRFRIEKLEEKNDGKTSFQEMIRWRADERFWQDNFFQARQCMRNKFSPTDLISAVKCFIQLEFNILPHSHDYVKLKVMLQTLFHELYENINIDSVLTLMQEQQAAKLSTARALYLERIAYITARQATNPLLSNPRTKNSPLSWEIFVKSAKSTCGFIRDFIRGDKVVTRSAISVSHFGMGSKPKFLFEIVNSGRIFFSPESDIRKAYLLNNRLCG